MTRPAFVGQPVLLLTHSTATGWRVYAALVCNTDEDRTGLLFVPGLNEFSNPTLVSNWYRHHAERGKSLSFFVHLDERHLIEQAVEGKPWADDIADQLDRILGPKEPRL